MKERGGRRDKEFDQDELSQRVQARRARVANFSGLQPEELVTASPSPSCWPHLHEASAVLCLFLTTWWQHLQAS